MTENSQPPADLDLERRIVAWVHGELSPAESAELQRQIQANPEAAQRMRQIEAVHRLLGEACAPASSPKQLGSERRAALLAKLRQAPGAPEELADVATAGVGGAERSRDGAKSISRRWYVFPRWVVSAAACLVLGLVSFQLLRNAEKHAAAPPHGVALLESMPAQADAELAAPPQAMHALMMPPVAAGSLERRREAPLPRVQFDKPLPGGPRKPQSLIPSAPPASVEPQGLGELSVTYADGRPPALRAIEGRRDRNDLLPPQRKAAKRDAGQTFGAYGGQVLPPSLSEPRDLLAQDGAVELSPFEQGPTSAGRKQNGALPRESERQAASEVALAALQSAERRKASAPREVQASLQPVSTFSLHVSDVSFQLAQAALASGQRPEPDRIRPEEFYNAFDYGDPAASMEEKVACRIEQAAHPTAQQRNLVRIAVRVPTEGRGAGQPLRLTLLLDTSGSMEREDRAASVRQAVQVLGSLLGPQDRVSLVGFARQPRLLADQLPGNEASQLVDIVARTPAEGGTHLEEALKVAGEVAQRTQVPGAQNRIVLLTDGAANLGNADPAQLSRRVETLRQQGIAFDACGVGLSGLDDTVLEALTRKGDGRYYVLDSPEAADAAFAQQLAGAFRPAARDVKVQVRFNPARVGSYRLIGFEQHRLNEEDFRNDQVDAAELAAGEAANALYEVEPLPDGEGELGEVYVRFRDAATGAMIERSWTLRYEPDAAPFDRAAPSLQLAGTAAVMAEALQQGAGLGPVPLEVLAPAVNRLRAHYAGQARVQQLVEMYAVLRKQAQR